MLKFKIVADSSSDVIELGSVPFSSAPLKIITSDREFTDDKNLCIDEMVNILYSCKGQSSTSCPSPEDWLRTFGDAENIFCVTITGTLSGSYNSANIAKQMYEEMYPGRKVFVINSLSAGPEIKLIIEKLAEMISKDASFDSICETVMNYKKETGLVFMLESMRNLANNGRISPLVAKAVGLLGIRIIGKASEQGDLQALDKCRGEDRAITAIVKRMKEEGLKNGKVRIAHCFNEAAASKLVEKIKSEFEGVSSEVYSCRGLCSFYAEKGGLLVGFEKR